MPCSLRQQNEARHVDAAAHPFSHVGVNGAVGARHNKWATGEAPLLVAVKQLEVALRRALLIVVCRGLAAQPPHVGRDGQRQRLEALLVQRRQDCCRGRLKLHQGWRHVQLLRQARVDSQQMLRKASDAQPGVRLRHMHGQRYACVGAQALRLVVVG